MGVSGVGDSGEPDRLMIRPNWPNPTNGPAHFSLGLPTQSDFSVSLYDVRGRRVHHQLVKDAPRGWRTVSFSGRDDGGKPLPSGVYFYKVEANGETLVDKMILTR